MQLSSIDVGNGIRDDMNVKMVFVLMDTYQTLMSREEFLTELSSDLQALLRRDLLVFVEAEDVVRIHSS